jgi:hypothetical protein
MKRTLLLPVLAVCATAVPLSGQTTSPGLPPKDCPSDHRDGLLMEDGVERYGIPARRVVEAWLSPPHDSWGRVHSGTQNVDVSTLRVLSDETDSSICRRLTSILTGGERSAPPPVPWVFFTAGGFYFVSDWKPAQLLSNYTTSYGHVMVFDSAFTLRGTYAF